MLHRVLPESPDTPPDSTFTITIKQFEKFLISRKNETVHRLCDWKKIRGQGGYILTFDDGYKDNLEYALPLLEKYNVPATIFITSGFINGDAFPLERLLYKGLQEKVFYETHRYELKFGGYGQRLNKLRGLIGDNFETDRSLFMNWDEIQRLNNHPLIDIGYHSHSHPALAKSNIFQTWLELRKPIKIISQHTDLNHKIIAYPYGSNSMITRALARLAGYKIGVGTVHKMADKSSDIMRLPRLDIMEAVE